tara:strand:- start:2606 stop:3142 length:537 start_codon:yes stop_codon:yes gene_type:complete
MNKSKSYPIIYENEVFNFNKCQSSDNLKDKLNHFYFEDFFEGDGQLGISFIKDSSNKPIVKSIIPNTVASETYGLHPSMILIEIDGKDITNKPYENIMKSIHKKWIKNNRIHLKFKKVIKKEIYTILLSNNLIKYYDKFVELGASFKEDFEYVEYNDLIKMDMNREEIEQFRNINPNI